MTVPPPQKFVALAVSEATPTTTTAEVALQPAYVAVRVFTPALSVNVHRLEDGD